MIKDKKPPLYSYINACTVIHFLDIYDLRFFESGRTGRSFWRANTRSWSGGLK
jgi:hypothetical protein